MPLHLPRDVVQFPNGNSTHSTIINGVYFNKTALGTFGYLLYSNNTISNVSSCYLIFDEFKPAMLDNGTWVNGTTCYIPYYNIQTRGILSIVFGTLFGLTIVFTMINLRKHGKVYLRESKRFRVVGRRWQYYWMLFVAACGVISTLTGVDIDRYYLQDLPIVLQSFFFTLMMPSALAMVWEATRHWGSWQERQIYDADPFLLTQHDRRAKVQFWIPLVFYVFAFLSFFMLIPRSWSDIQKQNTYWQREHIARPAVTGKRDKAGAILAVFAFAVICYSLWHSLKHYKGGSWFRCPWKLASSAVLLAVRLGYGLTSAWDWNFSISQVGVQLGWPFGLGYAPILLIVVILEAAGFIEENEDKVLIQQRTARGRIYDADLQITKKPNWWQKNLKDRYLSDDQRLRNLTTEVDAETRTGRSFELKRINNDPLSRADESENPFRDDATDQLESLKLKHDSDGEKSKRSRADGDTATQDLQFHPQPPIRSMLDV